MYWHFDIEFELKILGHTKEWLKKWKRGIFLSMCKACVNVRKLFSIIFFSICHKNKHRNNCTQSDPISTQNEDSLQHLNSFVQRHTSFSFSAPSAPQLVTSACISITNQHEHSLQHLSSFLQRHILFRFSSPSELLTIVSWPPPSTWRRYLVCSLPRQILRLLSSSG